MKSSLATAMVTVLALAAPATPAQDPSPAADVTPAPAPGLPGGVIVMWSGTFDTVPDGWALCDGENGTPDLRNRFVLGAGTAQYLGTIGGSLSHRHNVRNHSHQIDPPAQRQRPVYGYTTYGGQGAHGRYYRQPGQTFDLRKFRSGPATATLNTKSNLPPYYKIAFIMKL